MGIEERASLMLDELIAHSELRFGKCGPEDVGHWAEQVVIELTGEGLTVRITHDADGNVVFREALK